MPNKYNFSNLILIIEDSSLIIYLFITLDLS